MAIKLMYITNRPEIAKIAESVGVDRIFVDMEHIGKEERQPGDTVKSHHTFEDISLIRKTITRAELLVRINPVHSAESGYFGTEREVDEAVARGADIIMLPYFKTLEEAKHFISCVRGRTKTMLLVETPEAVNIIDELVELDGVDEMYIGLNDLSLGYKKKFMFEVLSDGTVENLCLKMRNKGIPYGFGGLASLEKGMVPGKMVLKEHYRLGSTSVILSRSFCNPDRITELEAISAIFNSEVKRIREYEDRCIEHARFFFENMQNMKDSIKRIAEEK